jgi:carbon monoxide dehydrogenase subunit G
MITLQRSKVVAAGPKEVFESLSDPQELTRLIPRVQKVDVLERHADHARIATHMSMGGIFGTIRCEGELRWVEPSSITFTVQKPLPLENRWSLTPIVGGTEITVMMSLDLVPLLGPLAQFVPANAVTDILGKDIDGALQRIADTVSGNLHEQSVGA